MTTQSSIRKMLKSCTSRTIRKPSAGWRPLLEALEPRAMFSVSFGPRVDYNVAPGIDPRGVVAGDFTGDGKTDLLTDNFWGTDSVGLLRGNGDGTFQTNPAQLPGIQSGTDYMAVADVNRDGRADVIAATVNEFAVTVMYSRGDGTFNRVRLAAHSPSCVAVGDFNNDGVNDLAAGGFSFNYMTVLIGNPDGTFQPGRIYSTGGPLNNPDGPLSWSVAVGDVNNDGKQDLVASTTWHTASVLLGNGDGSFQTGVNYNLGGNRANSVAVADFNRDGNLDVVTANQDSGTISVLFGRGDGTFPTAITHPVGGNPASLALADFNGDGWRDVATVSSAGFSVLLGHGNGNFQSQVTYNTTPNRQWMAVADFNADGKPDVASVRNRAYVGPGGQLIRDDAAMIFLNTTTSSTAPLISVNQAARSGNEGSLITNSGIFADPQGNSTVTLTASVGTVTRNNAAGTWNWSYTPPDNTTNAIPVTITATAGGETATAAFNLTVNNVAPAPTFTGPDSGLPAQALTYTLRASDPSAVDQAAGFEYRIDWGDGSPIQVIPRAAGNGSGVNVTHAYASAGTYNARLTAIDKDGGQRTTPRPIAIAPANTNPRYAIPTKGTPPTTTDAHAGGGGGGARGILRDLAGDELVRELAH